QVPFLPELQVAKLSAAGVHLDEIGLVAIILNHKIKTEESREPEAAGNALRGCCHLRICDNTHNGGGAVRSSLADDLDADARQYLALPTDNGAIRWTAEDILLCNNRRRCTSPPRPQPESVTVQKEPLENL